MLMMGLGTCNIFFNLVTCDIYIGTNGPSLISYMTTNIVVGDVVCDDISLAQPLN